MLKKLAFGAIGLALLASPVFVMATIDPIAELQSQIQEMQARLAQLIAAKNQQVSNTGACLSLNNALIIGSTDATTNGEVSKLQRFLISEGVYPEALVTGYYGNLTAQAVMRWQKAHGMDFVTLKSGVGPMTRAKMREGCSTKSTCGLSITTPVPNATVSFPLIIQGVVDNSNRQSLGCSWGMFEGQAGIAQLYYYNGGAWIALGNSAPMLVDDWIATKTNFSVTLNFTNEGIGLSNGTPMKVVFTEENQRAKFPSKTLELPVSLAQRSQVTVLSPTAGDNWRIGEARTIKLSAPVTATWPEGDVIGVNLVRENGTDAGIIYGLKTGPQAQFDWNTSSTLNCLGAGCGDHANIVTPGRYKIRIGMGARVLAESGIFTISY